MTDEEKAEIKGLKTQIAEQEETIDAQDDKINFYVAKMNEYILKNKELEKKLDCYKAFESHCEEIEEDAKAIAKENEQLKEEMKEIIEDNDYYQEENRRLERENEELKKDKEWLDSTNNEQTKVILELQEHIREVENDSTNCEIWSYERIKELEYRIENYQLVENESKEIIAELKAKIEKMKSHCDCEFCINVISGDEFTVENTNKTVCEYCMENNKKLWEMRE